MLKFYNQLWEQNKKGEFYDFSIKWSLTKELVIKKKNLTILDYGCGVGRYIWEIIKINPKSKIFGLDISSTAIKIAKKKLPGVFFSVQNDDKKFPIKNESVDLILAMDVLEHIFDVQKIIHEFNRVLKPGGQIFITTPYYGLIKNLIIVFFGFDTVFDPTGGHIRFFSKKSLLSLLAKNGIEVSKLGYYGRFYPIPRAMYILARKIEGPKDYEKKL